MIYAILMFRGIKIASFPGSVQVALFSWELNLFTQVSIDDSTGIVNSWLGYGGSRLGPFRHAGVC